MISVLFLAPRVDEYIVNEDDDELIQVWTTHPIHQVHEYCGGVSQSKGHHYELKMPIAGSEGCLWNIFLKHP